MNNNLVLLITGAAKRIGAATARYFHQQGYNVVLTYHQSQQQALQLIDELNQQRPNSAKALALALNDSEAIADCAKTALNCFGRIDVLINNASSFYPTPLQQATLQQWDNLINSNVRAAFLLSQALSETLTQQQGCIINLVDIYADKPLLNHSIYNISKAAIAMLTKSLALDLAPNVRVNGVSPGAILWPENSDSAWQQSLLEKIPLQRLGSAEDIAKTAYFLAQSPYITGQIIAVDGGRSLNM